MTGSVFIVHSKGWACSNETSIEMYTESVRDQAGKLVAVHKTQSIKLLGVYGELPVDEAVDIVFKVDDPIMLISFKGRVKSVGSMAIINILEKTDEVRKILSKITLKN